jgi:iron complex outermembrane receptor protein
MLRTVCLLFILSHCISVSAQHVQDSVRLKEIVVKGVDSQSIRMRSSLNVSRINNDYMRENLSGSLMQTLKQIPGVKAMSIGSGQSKPAIRGLGFNRLIVAENGIKHEVNNGGKITD